MLPSLAILFGLLVCAIAWRGKRVDNAPLCSKCRFDLSGIWSPDTAASSRTVCPECGLELNVRTVRIGRRRKRRVMLACGVGQILAATTIGAATLATARPAWNKYKPVTLLTLEVRWGSLPTADAAIEELFRRNNAGNIQPEDWLGIAATRATDRVVAGEGIQRTVSFLGPSTFPLWVETLALASSEDLIKPEDRRRLASALTQTLDWRPPERLLAGQKLPNTATLPQGQSPAFGMVAFGVGADLLHLAIDGEPAEMQARAPGLIRWFGARSGATRSASTHSNLRLTEPTNRWPNIEPPLGEHTVRVTYRIEVYLGVQRPEEIAPNGVRTREPDLIQERTFDTRVSVFSSHDEMVERVTSSEGYAAPTVIAVDDWSEVGPWVIGEVRPREDGLVDATLTWGLRWREPSQASGIANRERVLPPQTVLAAKVYWDHAGQRRPLTERPDLEDAPIEVRLSGPRSAFTGFADLIAVPFGTDAIEVILVPDANVAVDHDDDRMWGDDVRLRVTLDWSEASTPTPGQPPLPADSGAR